jgi:hypothetical protein
MVRLKEKDSNLRRKKFRAEICAFGRWIQPRILRASRCFLRRRALRFGAARSIAAKPCW